MMAYEPLRPGCYYHIYNRGNNGENLFVQRRNYAYFLRLYARHIQPVAETFAYCLLPNHFHVAIRTLSEAEQEAYLHQSDPRAGRSSGFTLQEPSRAFNNLFIAYARALNRAIQRTGVLFERPFKRKIVDNRRYLLTLITYIHRNPQKHGMVGDFREWPWSSFNAILSQQSSRVQRDEVLAWYNGRANFTEAHSAEQDRQQIAPLLLEDWF